jgi:hypothetical protein
MRLLLLLAFILAAATVAVTPRAEASDVVGSQDACTQRSAATGGASNHASLVVTFDDDRTITFCIEFSEESITGIELLERSGLPVNRGTAGGLGSQVCMIDGQGCSDPGDCFCQCKGGTCAYWIYHRRNNGVWQYSSIGAGIRTIRDGDADAWVWGGSGDTPGAPAPECPEATPEPSPVPSPTPSLTPRPSATTRTSATPAVEPTQTPVPVNSPLPALAAPTSASEAPLSQPTTTLPNALPTSAVLGAQQDPQPSATATPGPGARTTSPTPAASRTPSRKTPIGAIQVSDDEGKRNLASQDGGGDWSWRSTAMFGGVAAILIAVGGGAIWRRRAGY